MTEIDNEGLYKKASAAVDSWLSLHAGETFDLDVICRQLEIHDAAKRKLISIKLAYEVKHEKLEKNDRLYKVIDNDSTNKIIHWIEADDTDIFPFVWPTGHQDGTTFSCTERFVVSPGDLIVLGGETNKGKTALCLNFLWDNMDIWPCTLMGNEYYPGKFKRRVKTMDWADPIDSHGKAKFELLRVRNDWKYMVRPDNINIIDWISLEGEFYKIGAILDGIQDRLRKGIAIVSLQKGEGKTQAVGGHFSEDLASIYITMFNGYCQFKKVKEYHNPNPNGLMYGYDITDGTQFTDIHEVRKCPKCGGTGRFRMGECDGCHSKGIIDKGS